MRFVIRFNDREVVVEAESGVQAVIKMIDNLPNTMENLEFQVTGLYSGSIYRDM